MILAKSLQSQEPYEINLSDDAGAFYSRLKYLFNHHSFLNYMVVANEKKQHTLIKYTTLYQPYSDPELFSIIIRTNRLKTNIIDNITRNGSLTLNHLPLPLRDVSKVYNFPLLQNELDIKDTPFFTEELCQDMSAPCIGEASIRLGLSYESHIDIIKDEMTLVKLKLHMVSFDNVGYKRLTSPIISLSDILENPIKHNSINKHLSKAM